MNGKTQCHVDVNSPVMRVKKNFKTHKSKTVKVNIDIPNKINER